MRKLVSVANILAIVFSVVAMGMGKTDLGIFFILQGIFVNLVARDKDY